MVKTQMIRISLDTTTEKHTFVAGNNRNLREGDTNLDKNSPSRAFDGRNPFVVEWCCYEA